MDHLIYTITKQAHAELIDQAERAALAARVRRAGKRDGNGRWRPFQALLAWGAGRLVWRRGLQP
jgi:hypothetical protein